MNHDDKISPTRSTRGDPSKPWWRVALSRVVRALTVTYLAVLGCLVVFESSLVYPMPRREWGNWEPAGLNQEDVEFSSADGTRLHGWYVPNPTAVSHVLFCHGNGEDLGYMAGQLLEMRDRCNVSIFAFDYRGYGQSEGSPNELGIVADGQAAQAWLAQRETIAPDQIVIFGCSLGGGVAVQLAALIGAKGLVLDRTFDSMVEIAADQYRWAPIRWLMRNQYNSLAHIGNYQGPLLQMHGTLDRLVPIEAGRRLFDAAPTKQKRFLTVEGLDHNGSRPDELWSAFAQFLDAIESD